MKTPMERYEAATAPDGWLTVAGWTRLDADLRSAARQSCGDRQAKLLDRAADCLARAARLRAA